MLGSGRCVHITHSRELVGAGTLPAEVCVIGSGPADAFVAVDVASSGHHVLVVEAGTEEVDSDPSQILDRVEVSQDAIANIGFSRQLGGTSNLWTGRVAPLETIDFERREWIAGSGWPIPRSELEPFYRRVASTMRTPYEVFDGPHHFPGRLARTCVPNVGLHIKPFFFQHTPFNTGVYLRDAVANLDGRLRIIMGAQVRRLKFNPQTNTVEGATLAVRGGDTINLVAKLYIIAAGGLDTPRLLFNSAPEIGGLGNSAGLVGRFLSTHPKGDFGLCRLVQSGNLASPLFSRTKLSGGSIRNGIGLTAEVQKEIEGLNHYIQLTPIRKYQISEMPARKQTYRSAAVWRDQMVRRDFPALRLILGEGVRRILRLSRRSRLFVIRGFLDQFPNADNRVYPSQERDAFGDPKISLKWHLTSHDRQSFQAFLRYSDGALRRASEGEMVLDILSSSNRWPLIGIHSHFIGTTRMGRNEREGVVDRDLRVFGINNLFISGPSTFPTGGYANPFLTIAALALRLGRHIDLKLRPSETRPP